MCCVCRCNASVHFHSGVCDCLRSSSSLSRRGRVRMATWPSSGSSKFCLCDGKRLLSQQRVCVCVLRGCCLLSRSSRDCCRCGWLNCCVCCRCCCCCCC